MTSRILALILLLSLTIISGCGGGSFTPPVTAKSVITSAQVFSNTPQTWNFVDGFGHHMSIEVIPVACAFGSCGDISVWHYTKDSCPGYWGAHTPEQCAASTTLDELYFVLRHDDDGAWRSIGSTYIDQTGTKWKVQFFQHPGSTSPYTIIPASSNTGDVETITDYIFAALPSDADITDFSAMSGLPNYSTSWRTDTGIDNGKLISHQHEGCVIEHWEFDANGLQSVNPIVGLGNVGCLTLDPRLKMARTH